MEALGPDFLYCWKPSAWRSLYIWHIYYSNYIKVHRHCMFYLNNASACRHYSIFFLIHLQSSPYNPAVYCSGASVNGADTIIAMCHYISWNMGNQNRSCCIPFCILVLTQFQFHISALYSKHTYTPTSCFISLSSICHFRHHESYIHQTSLLWNLAAIFQTE